jgi:hypothetical protein
MSIEDQLEEEAHKQIDASLENIPHNYIVMGTGPNVKSIWDFVCGYEYGCIVTGVANYYRFKIRGEIDVPLEEMKYVTSQIKEIVRDRLPEIRQAISRAEANLRNDHSS